MPEEAIDPVARLGAAVQRAREALAAERKRSRKLAAELEAAEKRAAEERSEIGERVEALAEGLEELLAEGDS